MVTKNFKMVLASLLAEVSINSVAFGRIPFKDVSGNTRYYRPLLSSSYGYPASSTQSFSSSGTTSGVVVGSGTTPSTEDDYALEAPISSGLNGVTNVSQNLDSNGNLYCEITLSLANTTNAAIVVNEIGYIQSIPYATQSATSGSVVSTLFDRTVLDTPVTIPAGGTKVIEYTLKTVVS